MKLIFDEEEEEISFVREISRIEINWRLIFERMEIN